MAGNFQRRLSGLEKHLVIGDDQREYRRLVRRCYNMQRVSDLALFVSGACALLGEDEPDWVVDEFERPIPHSAPSHQVAKAEAQAKDYYTQTEHPDCLDGDDLSWLFDESEKITGRSFATLGEVRDYLSSLPSKPKLTKDN
jgi:hypothetical protein